MPAKNSTIQGRFLNSSLRSVLNLADSSAEEATRSLVVAKVIQNSVTETSAKMPMVIWKPSASSSTPKCFTSGRTSMEISRPPPKAPTKRKLERTVLSLDWGVITPIKAE